MRVGAVQPAFAVMDIALDADTVAVDLCPRRITDHLDPGLVGVRLEDTDLAKRAFAPCELLNKGDRTLMNGTGSFLARRAHEWRRSSGVRRFSCRLRPRVANVQARGP